MKRRPPMDTIKKQMSFSPDFIADSVDTIDFDYLRQLGIKACLIDLDGTVVQKGKFEVNAEIVRALKSQPIKIYIATNRPGSRSLKNLKELLNANGVLHPVGIWGKPFPKYYAQAAARHGLNPNELVMIGDRYVQDILGANMAGLRTVLVKKNYKPSNVFDSMLSDIENNKTNKLSRSYISVRSR